METRNIKITLDKAREWYNSNNEALKEIGLQAFSKEELAAFDFTKIKTFEDALAILQYSKYEKIHITEAINSISMYSKASAAMCKLNIIRKALNLGKDLHLIKNSGDSNLYYPYNPFITENSDFYESELNSGEMEIIGKIKSEGTLYKVLSGDAAYSEYVGLGRFVYYTGVGAANADIGFLGCAAEEIAQHFGKYFGMLITEAKYGDLLDFEIIESKYQ
nr:MAG TPA: hypothetical protein [Bacteriophage sp.]